MEVKVFEAKTKEEAIEKAITELKVKEEEMLYFKEEIKGKLFKSASVKINVVTINEVSEYLKEFIVNLLKNINIDATIETKIRDNQINIKMFSNNNAILIGKNGQTLKALQIYLRQVIYSKIGCYPYILLDVEDYKEKQEHRLERLAKSIAREVRTTKSSVTMDNMNSYERRIVHNVLSKYDDISSNSEGEEPNRHIVVKLK